MIAEIFHVVKVRNGIIRSYHLGQREKIRNNLKSNPVVPAANVSYIIN